MMTECSHRFTTGRYSPLRYPGGKGKVFKFVRQIIRSNGLADGLYVEPYAGGASVAVELLLTEEVSRIAINDLSPQVYSFWFAALQETESFCQMIAETPLTVEEWDRQKAILKAGKTHDRLKLGFATFYLNRTNRSGILNGGIIGGRAQKGQWLIDARYNAKALIGKIRAIANLRDRIALSNEDAVSFLRNGADQWGPRTLIYLDPPYYVKGKHLYHHYYKHEDHLEVRTAVEQIKAQRWIVSYDDTPEISEIYAGENWLKYTIGYSARTHGSGSEIMFFGPGITAPECCGSMVEVARA